MYITPYKCIYDCSLRIHSNVTTQPRYQRGPHPLDVDIRWKRDYAQSLDTSSLHRNASTQRISQRPIGRSDTSSHSLYLTHSMTSTRPQPKQLRHPVLDRDRLSAQCRHLARSHISHMTVKSSPWSVRCALCIPI